MEIKLCKSAQLAWFAEVTELIFSLHCSGHFLDSVFPIPWLCPGCLGLMLTVRQPMPGVLTAVKRALPSLLQKIIFHTLICRIKSECQERKKCKEKAGQWLQLSPQRWASRWQLVSLFGICLHAEKLACRFLSAKCHNGMQSKGEP